MVTEATRLLLASGFVTSASVVLVDDDCERHLAN
jgi:hypothetical protein